MEISPALVAMKNKKTFQNCDDITNKHNKLQRDYNTLARDFATWQNKFEECNKKISEIKK